MPINATQFCASLLAACSPATVRRSCLACLVAGLVEFIGGALIALGLFTRVAAFTASGEMAIAYFKAHASRGFWPILNHGELAVLYCFVFLYICFRGAGIWSIDAFVLRTRARPNQVMQ